MKKGGKGKVDAAFQANREPVLHEIAKLSNADDRAVALKNLAHHHSKWGQYADAREYIYLHTCKNLAHHHSKWGQ